MGKTLSRVAHIFKLPVLLSAALLQIQCANNKTASPDDMYKNIYVDQFKLTYFRTLLTKSYNNSQAIREIIAQDHSGFTEPVLSDNDIKLIDSLVTVDNLNLKADSVKSTGRVAEGAEGKQTLSYILDKLESKWLDSLAKKRYETLETNPFEL